MYTEGYDDLSGAEKQLSSRHVAGVPQGDNLRLQREIEKLKKSLEKEQFFNRLLDQELKELKESQTSNTSYDPNVFNRPTGVSKGAFYTLLLISLAMAGFIAYHFYNNNFTLPGIVVDAPAVSVPHTVTNSGGGTSALVPSSVAPSNENASQKESNVKGQPKLPGAAAKTLTDSVPNIIGKSKPATQQPAAHEEQQTTDQSAVENGDPHQTNAPTTDPQNSNSTSTEQPSSSVPSTNAPAPVEDNSKVTGTYRVTSKANFYNSPDENTMRSTFISAGDKTVSALDEKNGFIFVVYTNELGYVSKGWLSKADLTKVE